jgi:hypothetical protein
MVLAGKQKRKWPAAAGSGSGRGGCKYDLNAVYTTHACCLRISPGSAWACGACSKQGSGGPINLQTDSTETPGKMAQLARGVLRKKIDALELAL